MLSILKDEKISDHDLAFAKQVYEHFKCKNFGDYHDLYLKLDTILLKDVFDNFRETCYKNYKLDPVYYISAPQLSDAASLKYTGQELELLTDQENYEIFEKGIRGGIFNIPHRHAIANNCYFYDGKHGKTIKLSQEIAEKKGIWNSKKHISYILYLDCNNLYGWALSQSLPIGEFLNYNLLESKNDEKFNKLKYKPADFTNDLILSLDDNGEYPICNL